MKPGDVVVLKSGGPKMTVEGQSLLYPDMVNCKWFLVDGTWRRDQFKPEMLDHAPVDPSDPTRGEPTR